ncbi:MAG: DUF4190 domain-containing protein [Phycisphaerales bacterium]|nr:DUF4190 domain-containing protein [Phycisphaerales bacterium]MCB9856170.1 DUF4190 domain-containing protein [Phycisphaerales bacterium]
MLQENHQSDDDSAPIALDYALGGGPKPSRAEAVFALILGVLAVTIGLVVPFIIGLLAIVVGFTALIRIQQSPTQRRGLPMTILAIALGAASLAIQFVAHRELSGFRKNALNSACQANLHSLGIAIRNYAQIESDGAFPDDLSKLRFSQYASPIHFQCPAVPETRRCYYYVPGYSLSSKPTDVIMFEVDDDHEGGGGNVLYQDGHVVFLSNTKLQEVIDENKDRAK